MNENEFSILPLKQLGNKTIQHRKYDNLLTFMEMYVFYTVNDHMVINPYRQ